MTVAGFAWAGEIDIARVDVSTDAGATWQPARLTGQAEKFAWRRFEFAYDATRQDTHTILSRATDARGNTQPIVPQWNPSGYLWNAPGPGAHRGEGVSRAAIGVALLATLAFATPAPRPAGGRRPARRSGVAVARARASAATRPT